MRLAKAQMTDIPEIVEVSRKCGLVVSEKAIRRYFFESPCRYWLPDVRGGFVIKNDDNKVVGFQGMSPCDVLCGGKQFPAYQLGVLAILPGYGCMMFELMDVIIAFADKALLCGNTSNIKSSKLWTQYAELSSGPKCCEFYQFSLTPMGGVLRAFAPEPKMTIPAGVADFLAAYEKGGRLMTSRTVDRLKWLYDGMDGKKNAFVSVNRNGEIYGYAVLRRKQLKKTPFFRFEIMDILAKDDSESLLREVVHEAERFSALHGGVMLEYLGARNLLPKKRKLKANPFCWCTRIKELEIALRREPVSFFGPYDGDRCM